MKQQTTNILKSLKVINVAFVQTAGLVVCVSKAFDTR